MCECTSCRRTVSTRCVMTSHAAFMLASLPACMSVCLYAWSWMVSIPPESACDAGRVQLPRQCALRAHGYLDYSTGISSHVWAQCARRSVERRLAFSSLPASPGVPMTSLITLFAPATPLLISPIPGKEPEGGALHHPPTHPPGRLPCVLRLVGVGGCRGVGRVPKQVATRPRPGAEGGADGIPRRYHW